MNKQYNFARVATADVPRSRFDRSFKHVTTFDVDFLIPIYTDIAYPGDVCNFSADVFLRIGSPLSTPIMSNLKASLFAFGS